ncbi:MAG TPA: CoA-binding protein [Anaerolineae bacterium]|nr:CoA-binding protein [Anaerolineae bacterium]
MNAPERPTSRGGGEVPPKGEIPLLDTNGALDVLRTARRIAIVGASPNPWRPSHSVMRYLLDQGYECVPITPRADQVLEQRSYPTLEAAVEETGASFDVVDVFRRPEHAPEIARSAVALGCGTLWLQLGVISTEAARIAHTGGLRVVMDRCSAIDHRLLRALRA